MMIRAKLCDLFGIEFPIIQAGIKSMISAPLNTIAASATAGYLGAAAFGPLARTEGLVHSYSVAAGWGGPRSSGWQPS